MEVIIRMKLHVCMAGLKIMKQNIRKQIRNTVRSEAIAVILFKQRQHLDVNGNGNVNLNTLEVFI